jgi:hypothetical protein
MNSRYININDKFLIEYSNLTYAKDYKYDIVNNSYTKRKSFYISYEHAKDAVYNRDNGVERLESPLSNTWLYLDVDRFTSKYDISNIIDKTPILPLRFNKVRIHILSGYNFSDTQGFILQTYLKDIKNEPINLLNFAFVSDFPNDTISFNPEPLYINSKYYNRYIELDLLSPEYLLTDNNFKFIIDELTEQPIDDKTLLYIDFHQISNIDESIIYTDSVISRAETVVDKYKYFSLIINEVGDYFEHYATFKGGFPNEFIDNMSSMNRSWNIIHRLEVFEQLGHSIIKTDEIEKIQRSNFNLPLRFRPILLHSGTAYSFSIKYTCIFKDMTTGEQFFRTANISKLNPKKYGINLQKINIDNFSKINIYHRPDVNLVNQYSATDNGKLNTRYINNYINRVELTHDSVIEITPFANVYQFQFNESIAQGLQFFLTFISDDGQKLYIPDIEDDNTDTILFFKVQEKLCERIRTFSNRVWYIIGVTTEGDATTLVKGSFII